MAKTMNLGKVAMTTAGDYDSSKSYERLTCVLYNHVSWVSRKEVPAGIVPGTNELYWQKVSERGEQGIQGPVGPQGNSAFDGNGVEIVNNLTQGGEAAVLSAEQGKILDTKLTELSEETISNSLSPLEGYYGSRVPQGGGFVEIARFYLNKGYKYRLYVKTERPTPSGGYYVTGIYDENGSTIAEVGMAEQTEATSSVFEATERRLVLLKSELTIPFDWNIEIVEISKFDNTSNDFIVDAIIGGWDKPDSKLYIDYIYRNDASYGSGIRVMESNGSQFFYKSFEGYQNGILAIKENVGNYSLQLTINWDAYQDGFNAILEKPLYFPKSAYFPLNSLDNKVQEICSYLPYHFEKQSSMLYDDLHDEIGIELKKGAKIINNGVELMIATNTSIADYVIIPFGGVYFLDSDKQFLCSVPVGLVDFDYIPYASPEELEDLRKAITESSTDKVEIVLPSKIYAVVGDTLQLFYRSICNCAKMEAYDFCAVADYGKSYPRYWEYAPTAADAGKSFTLTINVRSTTTNIVGTQQVTIQVVSALSASSAKKILCVGDSTAVNGVWVGELRRRLVELDGDGTPLNPKGLGLPNISFVGRKQGSLIDVPLEATGGWRVTNYADKGERAIRFQVKNVNTLTIGAAYNYGSNIFVVQEVNVTNGVGNIRCTLLSSYTAPSASGTLIKSSGSGDDKIAYTSYSEETFSPFWNDATNKLDFKQYADKFCGGSIDVLIWHCGANDIFGGTQENINAAVSAFRAIVTQYHADFPNGKIVLSSIPLGSLNGGFAANYGSSSYANAIVYMNAAQQYAKALQDLCAEYSYAFYASAMEEFDAENGYPIKSVAVNNRGSIMEDIGTNALHPTDEGSLMVADAIYRTINAMTL